MDLQLKSPNYTAKGIIGQTWEFLVQEGVIRRSHSAWLGSDGDQIDQGCLPVRKCRLLSNLPPEYDRFGGASTQAP